MNMENELKEEKLRAEIDYLNAQKEQLESETSLNEAKKDAVESISSFIDLAEWLMWMYGFTALTGVILEVVITTQGTKTETRN